MLFFEKKTYTLTKLVRGAVPPYGRITNYIAIQVSLYRLHSYFITYSRACPPDNFKFFFFSIFGETLPVSVVPFLHTLYPYLKES